MKTKFLALLVGLLAVSTSVVVAQEKGVMKFEKTSHDFGKVDEQDKTATVKFEFTNNGKAPIVISNVAASCGCTTPEWTKEPVLPGKKGSITVTYGTLGRVGPFNKVVTVNSNADTPSVVLEIKGEVIRKQ